MLIAGKPSEKFSQFLSTLNIDQLSKGVVIAFSGGPDSRVLLDLAIKQCSKVYAFYYVHNLRPENEQKSELALVKTVCDNYNIPLKIGESEAGVIEKQGKIKGIGTEAYARSIRYRELDDYCRTLDAGYIFTAHTSDDDVETLIMRFFQGSAVLKGIPAVRDNIARPLLNVSKSDIYIYIEENKLEYSIDSTNSSGKYLRNRVRSEILPVVKTVFPHFSDSVAQIKAQINEIHDFIEESVNNLMPWQYISETDEWEIDINRFISAPCTIRIASMYRCINSLFPDSEERIPRAFFNALPENISNRKILLKGHGVVLERRKQNIILRNDSFDSDKEYVYILNCKSSIRVGELEIMITDSAEDSGWENAGSFFSADTQFILRSRRPGDTISAGRQKKKLKKLFSEWGIPHYKRHSVPLVEDKNHIIAVLAGPLGGKNQLCNSVEKDTISGNTDKIRYFLLLRGV